MPFMKQYKRSFFVAKRTLDLTLSIGALVILFPLLLLTALLVKLTSKGPVFYSQERIGMLGQPFMLHKFRSMVTDAEKHTGPVLAKPKDERITTFGRFMRRTRLDEFPQIWNVIKGEMSVVGPRPERKFFIEKHIELQGLRLRVKPGLTGLAQIEGTYHSLPREKLTFDEFYIKNMSIALDLKIILRTVWVLVSQKGT